ncbi:MAG: hypothetical protein WBF79_13125 [Rhodococcus sp. (in: high G+C Gram-positive bacteria)]
MARVALIGSYLAVLAVCIVVAVLGPETMPAHFGADGSATREQSRGAFAATMAAISTAMLILFLGMEQLLTRLPARMINLPGRERHRYWTAPERREQLNRTMAEDMQWIGTMSMLLLVGVVVSSVAGAESGRLPVPVLLTLIGVYLVAVLAYLWWMLRRRYRVPE